MKFLKLTAPEGTVVVLNLAHIIGVGARRDNEGNIVGSYVETVKNDDGWKVVEMPEVIEAMISEYLPNEPAYEVSQ